MRRTFAWVAGISVLGLLGSVPAVAETRVIEDRRGDGHRTAEITRLKVDNGVNDVTATMRFSVFRKQRATAVVLIEPVAGGYFAVGWDPTREYATVKGSKAVFVSIDEKGDVTPVECPELSVSIESEPRRMRVSFPQGCLGELAGDFRFSGLTELNQRDTDSTKRRKVAIELPVPV